ncbi:MAG: hypothetical protein J6C41_01885 [Oscillospiraceae bacterium]|nr:hypothetical protein [Oscillospiraceae bacterium]
MMKRILSIIVCLSLIVGMMPIFGLTASGEEYTVIDEIPVTILTETTYSPWGAPYGGGWVPVMGTESGQPDGGAFCAWSDAYYAQIVSEGKQDAGAMHMKSTAGSTVAVGINIGMTPGETYTLGMWVKGATTNPNKVLSLYANGDGTIIGAAEYSADGATASAAISDGWTYVEKTFTANLNQLNLWASNWGENDIYIDNITVKNSSGADLMAGYGDFYTYGEVVKDSDVTNELIDEAFLDASTIVASYNATEKVWMPMLPAGVEADGWPTWDTEHYAELVVNGYADAGSLHMVSAAGKNTGLAINAGMTVGEQYTLSLWAKGTAQSQSLFSYANGDAVIIETAEALSNEWKQFTVTFTANLSQLNLCCRDWGSNDVYVDNITLTDADGNELLGCAGNFCHKAVVDAAVAPSCTEAGKSEGKHCSVCNEIFIAQTEIAALGHSFGAPDSDRHSRCVNCGISKQWPDAQMLDASKVSDDWAGAPVGQWVSFTPWGSYQSNWPAWEDGVSYAQIAEDGHNDPGALHMVSAGKNVGVVINPGLVPGETYTLGLWAKGTSNSGKVLAVYGHGDPVVIGAAAELGADWTYYSISFTADRSGIALYTSDWGTATDLYIDNITLKNAADTDLLSGNGDFYTYITPEEPAELVSIDTSVAYPSYGGAPTDKWSVMYEIGEPTQYWPAWNSDRPYGEIVAEGNLDAGSLHLASDGTKNVGVAIGVNLVNGQSYTLGLWAKGTSNSGRVLFSYGNGDAIIIGAAQNLSADWTYYEVTVTADVRKQLNLVASDWGTTDVYIDNVTLKNADGVDLLAGYGDFCKVENKEDPNVPTDDVVSGTADAINTGKQSWDGLSHMDAWTPFFPAGIRADTNWTAWETEGDSYNYAEIAAIGKSDAGALHFAHSSANENVGVALEAGMIPGNTYILKAYVKGYTKTTDGGLQMYANGDGMIAKFGYHQVAENNADWVQVTHTFVADRTALQLMVSGSTGVADIYVDDLQIIDSDGNNILGNKGNFSVVSQDIPDLAVISSNVERAYRWYWNADALGGATLTPSVNNNVEIIAEGCEDPGALNIWQNETKQDLCLTLLNTMALDRSDNKTYTLSMNVKGVFGNSGEILSVFPAYMTETEAKEQMNITKELKKVLGITCGEYERFYVPEWTNIQFELPYNGGDNGFAYLVLKMSQYVWGSHFYIDNIRVLDPEGNDVLGGAGNFMDSGSESCPIILPADGAEILNSNTMYYMFYAGQSNVSISNHVEYGYTAGDQNFSVTYNGMTQPASNKNVTMQMAPAAEGQPIVFAITSTASSMDVPESMLEAAGRAGEFNIYDVVITPSGCSHSYSDWNVTASPTYTTAGSQSKTCALCGEVVTEEIPVLANPVTGWNITLKDNIGVNFRMALAETDVVAVTVNGNAVDCTIADGLFSVNVAAAQMMDEIAISVNGLPLANTYSVRKYADVILADSTKSDCHDLVKNMLVYGGAAQNYFGYNTENLASSGITVNAQVPVGDSNIGISGSANGVRFYGAALVLESKTAVRFYFAGSLEGLTVTANGGEAVVGTKNNMTYVEVSGINPQDLGEKIEVAVDGLSVSYSPLNYMIRMYNKADSTEEAKALVQALYGYYLAAANYTAA